MASRRQDLETHLIAKDDASAVINKVAGELDTLEKRDTSIELTAEDKATPEIKSLSQLLAGLSDEDKTVVLNAKVGDAERNIDRILRSLRDVDKMDQQEIDVRVKMLGDARAELDRIQDEMRQIDGETVTVKVEAEGLDDLTDQLGGLPSALGPLGGILNKAGPVGAGAAAVAGSLVAAGVAAEDVALQAQTMATLTGATVEEASKLQAIWKTTGADVNDLNDIVVQLNGALQQSPELAGKLGINLNDGRNALERVVQVLDLADKGLISMTDQSTLFGEEGIRQVAQLIGQYDDLAHRYETMPAPVSKEDAEQALDLKNSMVEVQTVINQLVMTIGTAMIPLLELAAEKAADIAPKAQPAAEGLGQLLGVITTGLNKLQAIGVDPFKFSVDPRTLEFWEQPLNPFSPIVSGGDFAVTKATEVSKALFGEDLKGRSIISEEGKALQEDAASLAIATREAAAVAASKQAAADKERERVLKLQQQYTDGLLTTAEDRRLAELQVADAWVESVEAVVEADKKSKAWKDTIEEIGVALEEALAPFQDGTAQAEAFNTAFAKIGRGPGLATLDRLGDTKQAFQDIFQAIRDNGDSIPDIFNTGSERAREFNDLLQQAAQTVGEDLSTVLENAAGDFQAVRDRAAELREQFRDRFAAQFGLDLNVPEQKAKVEALVNAVIPTDKEINVGIKLAEHDLLKLKADLALSELEKLLPQTALQIRVDLAEGDITPQEAAQTAQVLLDQEGLEIELTPHTAKADEDLIKFAEKERTAALTVTPTGLDDTNDAIQLGPGGQGWPGIRVPVVPVFPPGYGAGGVGFTPGIGGHSVGPTALTAGATAPAVTSSGGVPAAFMIPVAAPQQSQPIVVHQHFNAAVIGDPFEVQRVVEDTNRRTLRLMPVNP